MAGTLPCNGLNGTCAGGPPSRYAAAPRVEYADPAVSGSLTHVCDQRAPVVTPAVNRLCHRVPARLRNTTGGVTEPAGKGRSAEVVIE